MEANRKFLKLLYEHVNKEKCDLDHQEFFELIEMHMIVFIMSLKRFFRDGESRDGSFRILQTSYPYAPLWHMWIYRQQGGAA